MGDKDRFDDGFNSEPEEQEKSTETPNFADSDTSEEAPQSKNSATNMSRKSAKIERPAFICQAKSYTTYKKGLKMCREEATRNSSL